MPLWVWLVGGTGVLYWLFGPKTPTASASAPPAQVPPGSAQTFPPFTQPVSLPAQGQGTDPNAMPTPPGTSPIIGPGGFGQ